MRPHLNRRELLITATAASLGLGAASMGEGQSKVSGGAEHEIREGMEPIVEHFTGDFDTYIPLLLGNGDLGGTFDPFGGTTYDELRAGGGKNRDIRTLLLAGVKAQDYWELLRWDPSIWKFNENTQRSLRDRLARGLGYPTAVTRGSPFQLRVAPAEGVFPGDVRDHTQTLDLYKAVLHTQYRLGDKLYEVEQFVHPTLSLLVYRFGGQGVQKLEIAADWGKPYLSVLYPESHFSVAPVDSGTRREGDILIIKARSNIYCNGVMAVGTVGGEIRGRTVTCRPGSIVLLAYGHQSVGEPVEQAKRTLERAGQLGYETLREQHLRWWRERAAKSYVRIPDQAMQRLYDRNLYYVICSQPRVTSEGTMSEAGLSASWESFCCSLFTGWGDFIHIGQLFAAGHADLADNQMAWYVRAMPAMKELARSQGLRGAMVPMKTNPGLQAHVPGSCYYNVCIHEHFPTGYAALCVEHYLRAQGWPRYAMETLWPVLREFAEFYLSLLTEVNGRLEQHFAPTHTMSESTMEPEAPNMIEVLSAAKGTFAIAADLAARLGLSETGRWRAYADKVDLSILKDPQVGYRYWSGATPFKAKLASALIVMHFQTGAECDPEAVMRTYRQIQRDEQFGRCGFDRMFQAISLARIGAAKEAHDLLRSVCDPARKLTDPNHVMFRESVPEHISGGLGGRMPYVMSNFFCYAVQQLLLQDWNNQRKLFPACPWQQAEFALWSEGTLIEGKRGARN
jgi:hypothetical protein